MDGRRGPWGGVFLASGLIAMVASLAAISSTSALPAAVVSWLVTIYAGYRIWRAAHPTARFWRELSRRTVAVITLFGATLVGLAAQANPVGALVIVGLIFAVVFAVGYLIARSLR